MSFVVAIDGPAASGKGTIARLVAEHYGFHHLDTGLLYRAVARDLIASNADLDDSDKAVGAAHRLDLAKLDRDVLSNHEIGEAASRVATLVPLRTALVDVQRLFAEREPGTVLDGRDIATVICPNAAVKLFVTATPEARATRRLREAEGRGAEHDYQDILDDLRKRDQRDRERATAPLVAADDAHLIDTTKMDIETAFQEVKRHIDAALVT